jgi:hypothetical protein
MRAVSQVFLGMAIVGGMVCCRQIENPAHREVVSRRPIETGIPAPSAATRARELSAEDRTIIEGILEGIAKTEGLKFLRADKEYDAKTAAWYLKFKWDQNKDKVKSVQDFIDLQSVGGEKGEITYYVQFADGTKKTAREVMEAAVKVLRGGKNSNDEIRMTNQIQMFK